MGGLPAALAEVCLDVSALLFLVSGASKLLGMRSFREGLIYIPYMPVAGTYLVAGTLPLVEVALAVGLFLNTLAAKVAALLLLATFCAVVAVVLHKRLKVPCGCFEGFGERHLSAATLWENGLLAIALATTVPIHARLHHVQSLPVAGIVLLAYLTVKELARQRRFLAGLRRQGIL